MTFFRAISCAAAIAAFPLSTQAASIDLADLGFERTGDQISASGLFGFGLGLGDFLASDFAGTFFSGGFNVADTSEYSFGYSVAPLDPSIGTMTSEGASAIGDTSTTVEALFENITATGTLFGNNGSSVLVTYTDLFGVDVQSGAEYSGFGSITIEFVQEVNVIPLPAGGLLLLTGAGALAALRRRKKRAAAV